MYEPNHPDFKAPTNLDIKIWRYMDLPKLLSMISTSAIWLSRADLLGDPHEGARGEVNVARRREVYGEHAESIAQQLESASRRMPRCVYVSCWHMAEIESVAMWRAYTTAGHGVAVHSTFRKLVNGVTDDKQFFAGAVNYIDPRMERMGEDNMLTPFLHKRRSFEYEREVRLICPTFESDWADPDADVPPGLALTADLGRVIDGVRIAPDQPRWFVEVVKTAVQKFGLDVEVAQSDLDTSPVY